MKDCFPSSKLKAARACNSLAMTQPCLETLKCSLRQARQESSENNEADRRRKRFVYFLGRGDSRLSSHLRVNSEYSRAFDRVPPRLSRQC